MVEYADVLRFAPFEEPEVRVLVPAFLDPVGDPEVPAVPFHLFLSATALGDQDGRVGVESTDGREMDAHHLLARPVRGQEGDFRWLHRAVRR